MKSEYLLKLEFIIGLLITDDTNPCSEFYRGYFSGIRSIFYSELGIEKIQKVLKEIDGFYDYLRKNNSYTSLTEEEIQKIYKEK